MNLKSDGTSGAYGLGNFGVGISRNVLSTNTIPEFDSPASILVHSLVLVSLKILDQSMLFI